MEDKLTLQFPIYALPPLTEEKAVQEMMKGMETLIEVGAVKGPIDEVLIDYEVNLEAGYTYAYLKEGSLIDGSKLSTVGSSSVYQVPKDLIKPADMITEEEKTFSAATIQERLRLSRMNPKVRLRYTIMDYKRYYKTKEKEFEKHPDRFKKLRDMFLTDLMGLFNEVLPFIEEGKQLNSLIGVSQVSPKMGQVARELSMVYRRALKSEKSSGQINKSVFQKLKATYADFMNQLIDVVFPGSQELMQEDDGGAEFQTTQLTRAASRTRTRSRNYSFTDEGRIRLYSTSENEDETLDTELDPEDQLDILV